MFVFFLVLINGQSLEDFAEFFVIVAAESVRSLCVFLAENYSDRAKSQRNVFRSDVYL